MTKIRNVLGISFPSIFVLVKVYLMIATLTIQFQEVMDFLDLDFLDVPVESRAFIPSVKRYGEKE